METTRTGNYYRIATVNGRFYIIKIEGNKMQLPSFVSPDKADIAFDNMEKKIKNSLKTA